MLTHAAMTAPAMPLDDHQPLQGTHQWARLPLVLGAVLLAVFVPTLVLSPEGQLNWLLEVGPGVVAMVALAVTYRRFPMTRLVYLGVFVHVLVLVYGGFYTYAKAPLGEWARHAFGWQRNNYDKVGHFAFGFFPVFALREVLLRRTRLERGAWLNFILVFVILGWAALYEDFEWWMALALDPAGGDRFLGTQGDVWDAQSDMFFAGVGATVALAFFARLHDAALRRLYTSVPARSPPPGATSP
jgi:putative membrane protein